MLMPIICLAGIITNSLVIATVYLKSNEKEMENNQYSYMGLAACCNLLILSFQSFSLINECGFKSKYQFEADYDSGYGLFCSSVRRAAFLQFYKIIFIEYLTHVINIMSNLSFICYSINRLSLVGQEHGKFVTKISELKIKSFFLITFIFCLALPVYKIFSFRPNYFKPDYNYPDYIDYSRISHTLVILYLSASILYNFITSIGFIVANLVVDINLLIAMKKVLAERAKKSIRAVQLNEVKEAKKK